MFASNIRGCPYTGDQAHFLSTGSGSGLIKHRLATPCGRRLGSNCRSYFRDNRQVEIVQLDPIIFLNDEIKLCSEENQYLTNSLTSNLQLFFWLTQLQHAFF